MILYLFKLIEGLFFFFIVSRLCNFRIKIPFLCPPLLLSVSLSEQNSEYIAQSYTPEAGKAGSKTRSQLHRCCTTFLHLYKEACKGSKVSLEPSLASTTLYQKFSSLTKQLFSMKFLQPENLWLAWPPSKASFRGSPRIWFPLLFSLGNQIIGSSFWN